jgi:anionic cell wall polymer biosynthesis LytR-Cps2A-Psr (LCP) family protein
MKKKKLLFLLLELMLILCVTAGVFYFQKRAAEEDKQLVRAEDTEKRFRPSISYQGQDYPLKRNMSSLLLIGVDKIEDDARPDDDELTYNFDLADFIVVLVFDHSNKTVTPFQVCRDAMCDVDTLRGLRRMQITLAHTMGNGKEESCITVKKAVERLAFGVPIDNYVSFTMDAVPLLNDLVGGVTVKLEDDIPQLGPEYRKGESVTLRGKKALQFVRYRDTSLLDDNLRRMSHHRLYLYAFTEAARSALSQDQDLAIKAFKLVNPFLCTDLTVDDVTKTVDNLCNYEILPAVTPTGVYTEGERFAEYILDETALWDCVHSVFCS